MSYNKRFIEWHREKNGKKNVEEDDVRDFIFSHFIQQGKKTSVVIAAMNFRFNYCEKKGFNYKGMNR